MFLKSLTDRKDGKNEGFLAAKHMGNLPLSQASVSLAFTWRNNSFP